MLPEKATAAAAETGTANTGIETIGIESGAMTVETGTETGTGIETAIESEIATETETAMAPLEIVIRIVAVTRPNALQPTMTRGYGTAAWQPLEAEAVLLEGMVGAASAITNRPSRSWTLPRWLKREERNSWR